MWRLLILGLEVVVLLDNTPESAFCDAYNIEMVWQLGGGKFQSSSELIMHIMIANKFN